MQTLPKSKCSDEVSLDRESFLPNQPHSFPKSNLHKKYSKKQNSLPNSNKKNDPIKPSIFLTQTHINEIISLSTLSTPIKSPLKLGRKIVFLQQIYVQPSSTINFSKISEDEECSSSRKMPLTTMMNSGILKKMKKQKYSDYFTWILSPNYTMKFKLFQICKKLFPPHFFAIIITIILIQIQNKLKSSCWLAEDCNCQGNIQVRILSYLRDFFLYWTLAILFGYYVIFFIKEFADLKLGKFLYFFACKASLLIIYFFPGEELRNALQYLYLPGLLAIAVFYIRYYRILNVGLKKFILNYTSPIFITFTLFINLFMTRDIFILIKRSIITTFKDQGLSLYQIVCVVYVFLFKTVLLTLVQKYYNLTLINNYKSYNAIILWIRVLLIASMAMEISNILEITLYSWGGALMIFVHIFVICKIYLKIDPVKMAARKILKKYFNKNWLDDDTTSIFLDNIMAAYMMDFQLIMIPRMLIIFFYRKWIIIHMVDYYSGCDLSISDNFKMFPEMLVSIMVINVGMPILIFFWQWKKYKKITFLYKIENFNFFQRTYMIVLMHAYLEMIFQDMRLLENKSDNIIK